MTHSLIVTNLFQNKRATRPQWLTNSAKPVFGSVRWLQFRFRNDSTDSREIWQTSGGLSSLQAHTK